MNCEHICIDDFNAVGDGIVNDQPAFIAALQHLETLGGGVLQLGAGKTYKVDDPIPMINGVIYRGSGRTGINRYPHPSTRIVSDKGAIFCNDANRTVQEVGFEHLMLESRVGGGHVFDWSYAGIVCKTRLKNITAFQQNKTKAVIYATSAGGIFSIWMDHLDYQYEPDCSVEPLHFRSSTLNSIVMDQFWSTPRVEMAGGSHSILMECTNPASVGMNIQISNGVFEWPVSGCVKLLSCSASVIRNCGSYDLHTVSPDQSAFEIGQGAGAPSTYCKLDNIRSIVGTVSAPDVRIDLSVPGQSGFEVSGCTLGWLDGVSPGNGNGIASVVSSIANYSNLSATILSAASGKGIGFVDQGAGCHNYELWNGSASNYAGWLTIEQDGNYIGGIHPNGAFLWGGTRWDAGFYISADGRSYGKAMYPGSNCGIHTGLGAPSPNLGDDNDIYIRGDGVAGQFIYRKATSVWTAMV